MEREGIIGLPGYVFLYPHVVERLKKANLKPLTAYTPDGIPQELI